MLHKYWKLEVPFKIKVFGWRTFGIRLPTKDLLKTRGISFLLNSLKLFFCNIDFEDNEDYLE